MHIITKCGTPKCGTPNVWTVKTEEGQRNCEDWRRAEAQALTALCETKKVRNAECVNVWTVKTEEGQRSDFWVWRRKRTQLKEMEVEWWKLIWFPGAILKHAFIGWLSLKTNWLPKIDSWSFTGDCARPFCRNCVESRENLFFECPFTWRIWRRIWGCIGPWHSCNLGRNHKMG